MDHLPFQIPKVGHIPNSAVSEEHHCNVPAVGGIAGGGRSATQNGVMAADRQARVEPQQPHWDTTYAAHPAMYGDRPSGPTVYAAKVFRDAGAQDVVELGAGHGRDALFFAREGFAVHALDFSATGLQQLSESTRTLGIGERVKTTVHDVRTPLPLPVASTDAVLAHMLLCMALSTEQIHAVVGEVRRVPRPGGVFVYTVATPGRPLRCGYPARRQHLRTRRLRCALLHPRLGHRPGYPFEEGELPRRLWRITQIRTM
jgi:SAM-dependent methyltransferase